MGRRRLKLRLFAVALLACAPALTSVTAAGAAKKFPYPDKSLAGTGKVELAPLLTTPVFAGLTESLTYTPTPSGAIWIGTARPNCDSVPACGMSSYLSRLGSNGGLVTSLGEGGSLGYTAGGQAKSAIASDAEGRAITATPETPGKVTVRRFLPSGALDPSFGAGGTATVNCECLAELAPALSVSVDAQGRILLAIPIEQGYQRTGYITLARLLPDGALDASFGSGGFVRSIVLNDAQYIAPNGAIFLVNHEGEIERAPTLERLSKKGAVVAGFDQRADAALRKVERGDEGFALNVVGLRFRAHGKVDVLAQKVDTTLIVRLRSNGSLETKFGKGGVKQLPKAISQAIPVGDGATLALVQQEGPEFIRLLPNYSLDPHFGNRGSYRIEGLGEEGGGLSIAPASNGRVTLVDRGLRFCRSQCSGPLPEIMRFRIGRAK